MASIVGIKIANGEFYSIVEENSQAKKRLVLTTVHDNQRSVQIDLYNSFTHTMVDAVYIGSMVIEKINPRPKGDPSIELIISSAINGDITAEAVDLDTSAHGERQTLTVSLKSMEEDNLNADIPDYELETNDAPPIGLYEKASYIRNGNKEKQFPWLIIIGAALVLAAIGLSLWLFFFRSGGADSIVSRPEQSPQASSSQPAPATPTASEQFPSAAQTVAPVVQSPPAAQTPPPVIQAPAQAPESTEPAARERPVPPVRSYRVPSTIPREGVAYRVRYGDTLWDIAEAFYRNPWLYPRIARFNNIRNPDLIISGTTIRVPPRN